MTDERSTLAPEEEKEEVVREEVGVGRVGLDGGREGLGCR